MGLQEALHSWDIREVSDASPWRPIIYPFKAVIPLALALLFIQGVSEFLKSAYAALEGRELFLGNGCPRGAKYERRDARGWSCSARCWPASSSASRSPSR